MARPRKFKNLTYARISIEAELLADAKNYAEELSLADGFSGLVSRLLVHQLKTKGRHVGTFPRRYKRALQS